MVFGVFELKEKRLARKHRETHDVEQTKKMVPLITCKTTVVNVLACCFLVSTFDLKTGVHIDSVNQLLLTGIRIYVNNDESSSHLGKITMRQEHQLRRALNVVRHHAEVDLEPLIRDSECFVDRVDIHSLDQIHIYYMTK